MSEREPTVTPKARLARDRRSPDWRRLEVASGRFERPVANGIAAALAEHREVFHGTARCIAHTIGNWAYDRGLPADALQLNLDYIIDRTWDVYDFVKEGGVRYAFNE